jgi:two-component system OmpR family response regulator
VQEGDWTGEPSDPFELRNQRAVVSKFMQRESQRSRRKKTKVMVCGDISLDSETLEIYQADELIPVTVTEFKLMQLFIQRPHVAFSRADLIMAVWRRCNGCSMRTIDNNIASLRQKFDRAGQPSLIQTVHGIGYRFVPRSDLMRSFNRSYSIQIR